MFCLAVEIYRPIKAYWLDVKKNHLSSKHTSVKIMLHMYAKLRNSSISIMKREGGENTYIFGIHFISCFLASFM